VAEKRLLARPGRGVRYDVAGASPMRGDPARERVAFVEVADRVADRRSVGLGANRTALGLLLGLGSVALAQRVDVHDAGLPLTRPPPSLPRGSLEQVSAHHPRRPSGDGRPTLALSLSSQLPA